MVNPSHCPIPPGFEVIGNFNDDFDHFKDTTGYGSYRFLPREQGVSKRWKNSNIRSANIVCGFQFKIGPDPGERWKEGPTGSKTIIRECKFGDVTLHFPRWGGDDMQRGGYIVGIKWFLDITEGEDFLTRGNLGKEYPHNTYGPRSFERRFFLQDRFRFRDQPNPASYCP